MMYSAKYILTTFLLSVFSTILLAQDTSVISSSQVNDSIPKIKIYTDIKAQIIDETIQYLSETNDELTEDDFELIYNYLYTTYSSPINLNKGNLVELRTELRDLRLLTELQVNALINHREKNGKFMVKYELQSISGFDITLINRILPFINIDNNLEKTTISLKEALANGKNRITIRGEYVIEQAKGFKDYIDPITGLVDNAEGIRKSKKYLGSPINIYTQYNFQYGNKISFGFTGQKDPGEEFFKGSQKGYDFFSAHLFLRNLGKIPGIGLKVKTLALGDYQAQFGQGLTFYMGRSIYKSSDVMAIKQNAIGLNKYTSAGEILFLRGAGVTLEYKKFEFTPFFSVRYQNSSDSLKSDITDVDGEILQEANATIDVGGLNQTEKAMRGKGEITEKIVGGNIKYKSNKLSIGATAVQTNYNIPIGSSNFYSKYQFKGITDLTNMGIDYNYNFRNMNFFGEFSRSSGTKSEDGYATLHGVLMSLDPRVSVSAMYRNYGLKYQSVGDHVEVLSEQSSTKANEEAFYLGTSLKLHKKVTLNTYLDNIKLPWVSYSNDAPAYRLDFNSQLNYTIKRKWEIYFRYRHRNRDEKSPDVVTGNVSIVDNYNVPATTNQYRVNLSYGVSSTVTMASRVEYLTYDKPGKLQETGYVIYQDVSYKSPYRNLPLSLHVHYAVFDVGSNTTAYVYERGVPFGWSWQYNGKGTRLNFVAKYQIKRGLNAYLRYNQFFYPYKNVQGSDLTEIQANTRSQVYGQIIYTF